jgi:hypothetical protein
MLDLYAQKPGARPGNGAAENMNPLRDVVWCLRSPQNVMKESDDRKEISAHASQQRKMLASNEHIRRSE